MASLIVSAMLISHDTVFSSLTYIHSQKPHRLAMNLLCVIFLIVRGTHDNNTVVLQIRARENAPFHYLFLFCFIYVNEGVNNKSWGRHSGSYPTSTRTIVQYRTLALAADQ